MTDITELPEGFSWTGNLFDSIDTQRPFRAPSPQAIPTNTRFRGLHLIKQCCHITVLSRNNLFAISAIYDLQKNSQHFSARKSKPKSDFPCGKIFQEGCTLMTAFNICQSCFFVLLLFYNPPPPPTPRPIHKQRRPILRARIV